MPTATTNVEGHELLLGVVAPVVPARTPDGNPTPDTNYMTVTGNVLSRPHPELGELIGGYFNRVSDQACRLTGNGAAMRNLQAAFMGEGQQLPSLQPVKTPDDWSLAVDFFCNRNLYAPVPASTLQWYNVSPINIQYQKAGHD